MFLLVVVVIVFSFSFSLCFGWVCFSFLVFRKFIFVIYTYSRASTARRQHLLLVAARLRLLLLQVVNGLLKFVKKKNTKTENSKIRHILQHFVFELCA